jgi:hypothetical protein
MRERDRVIKEGSALPVELAQRLRHDLGRYIQFHRRWLSPDASATERWAAIDDDLSRTHRGPEGTLSAAQVWEPFRQILTGERPMMSGLQMDWRSNPRVADLVQVMEELCAWSLVCLPDLGSLEQLDIGEAGVARVSSLCNALQDEARAAGESIDG